MSPCRIDQDQQAVLSVDLCRPARAPSILLRSAHFDDFDYALFPADGASTFDYTLVFVYLPATGFHFTFTRRFAAAVPVLPVWLRLRHPVERLSVSGTMALAKPVNLECKDLQEYLKSRTLEVLERLYDYPAICLAVYR